MGDYFRLSGPSEQVTFEQRAEGSERGLNSKGRELTNRGKSKCKGPEVGMCLKCWRNSEETSG